MGKLIYLDNAATTKTSPTVVEAMLPYFTEYYGNASSIYSIGTKSKEAINKSRETIAATLGAKPEEIYFTAGGSESDNWALKATAEAVSYTHLDVYKRQLKPRRYGTNRASSPSPGFRFSEACCSACFFLPSFFSPEMSLASCSLTARKPAAASEALRCSARCSIPPPH